MSPLKTVKDEKQRDPNGLVVTSCSVTVIREPQGKTKGFAKILLNDQILLDSLRIVDGANGLFVAYPNDPSLRDDEFNSLFYPITRDLRDHIEAVVLGKFRALTETK